MNFPCWRYHRDGRSVIVHTPEQHERETPSPEWHPMPVAHYSDEEYAAIIGPIEITMDPAPSIEEAEAEAAPIKRVATPKQLAALEKARANRKFGKE